DIRDGRATFRRVEDALHGLAALGPEPDDEVVLRLLASIDRLAFPDRPAEETLHLPRDRDVDLAVVSIELFQVCGMAVEDRQADHGDTPSSDRDNGKARRPARSRPALYLYQIDWSSRASISTSRTAPPSMNARIVSRSPRY